MRERYMPKHVLGNIQQQFENLPHLDNMVRESFEKNHVQPVQQARPQLWFYTALGAGLLVASTQMGLALERQAWPAWLMLGAGLSLILRR